MTQREEKAQETKKRIIESARKLITLKGIDNVSVDEIVKDAGVAKGSFYVYFKRKEDVLNAIGYHDFDNAYQEVIKSTGSAIEKLDYYMNRFMQIIIDGGIELCRSWVKTVIYPDSLEWSKLQFDITTINNILKHLQDNNQISNELNIEEFGVMINTQLYGMMICWAMSDGKYDYKQETKRFINQLKKLIKE